MKAARAVCRFLRTAATCLAPRNLSGNRKWHFAGRSEHAELVFFPEENIVVEMSVAVPNYPLSFLKELPIVVLLQEIKETERAPMVHGTGESSKSSPLPYKNVSSGVPMNPYYGIRRSQTHTLTAIADASRAYRGRVPVKDLPFAPTRGEAGEGGPTGGESGRRRSQAKPGAQSCGESWWCWCLPGARAARFGRRVRLVASTLPRPR